MIKSNQKNTICNTTYLKSLLGFQLRNQLVSSKQVTLTDKIGFDISADCNFIFLRFPGLTESSYTSICRVISGIAFFICYK